MPQTIHHLDSSGQSQALTIEQAFDLAQSSLKDDDQARDLLEQIVEADPHHRDALNLLGRICRNARQPVLAISCFEKAIALGEVSADMAILLGWHLVEEGKREPALAYFLHALKFPQPEGIAAGLHAYIAHALNELPSDDSASFDAAIEHFRQALTYAQEPEARARAWNGLGHALAQTNRFEAAAPCFVEALSVPDDPIPTAQRHCNLGAALGQLGQLEEELRCYDRALALVPSPLTRFNRSLAALRLGDLALGWREYEQRWGKGAPQGTTGRGFSEPLWEGGGISGRRILLHAEQGLGDTIQFVRYVPLVAALGADVTLEVQPTLKRLISSLPGGATIIARGEPLPQFDLQCPLLSLPLAFGTILETIPAATPYLQADTETRHAWAERFGKESGLKVGLVWAGSPKHKKDRIRSAPALSLAPLLGIPGTCFYSFQVGPRSADCSLLEPFGHLCDLSPLLTDLHETAAALAQMDVLVSVDTSVAHLGGALGVETWVLLPSVADWRWLEARADSPWYPGMKLFRQTTRGDWQTVIEQVREQLSARLSEPRPV